MDVRVADESAVPAAAVVKRLNRVFRQPRAARPVNSATRLEEAARSDANGTARCLSDEDILVLLQPGHEHTLAGLYERYGRIAYELAIRIVHQSALAEEAVKATFVAAWEEDRHTVDPIHAGAEIVAGVHREAVERARLVGTRTERSPGAEPWPPDGGAWTELERDLVHDALARLPGAERYVLVLAYYAGLTRDELSGGPRVSAEAVTARMQAGLGRLGTALSSHRTRGSDNGGPPLTSAAGRRQP
jgi:RNA polymerase sigma-70 factor (ECF subfamily)